MPANDDWLLPGGEAGYCTKGQSTTGKPGCSSASSKACE